MQDALVLGGGAAGLMAASTLASEGLDVLLLEARRRLGGRVWTVRPPGWPVPVELGAAFIHGRPAVVDGLLRRAKLGADPVPAEHRLAVDGRLAGAEPLWRAVEAALSRLRAGRARDRSFASVLRGNRGFEKRLAGHFVRNFHAADLRRIGEAGLAAFGGLGGSMRHRRIAEGYDRLLEPLVASLPAGTVRLGAEVRRVEWRPGHVSVEAARGRFEARACVVALPLGVLKSGRVRFDPALAAKQRALQRLEMGDAVRVALRFSREAWRAIESKLGGAAFVHQPGARFPVFWRGFRGPVLVAWCGGPPAAELGRSPAGPALASIASALGLRAGELERGLEDARSHDWSRDTFSRGAYSYAAVGGAGAHRELARPAGATLFFAGEATDFEGENATVAGALASGLRAARELLAEA